MNDMRSICMDFDSLLSKRMTVTAYVIATLNHKYPFPCFTQFVSNNCSEKPSANDQNIILRFTHMH